jgi:SOS-response transcriptional repressor LexA
MLRGIKGTYLYICDDNLREYFSKHIEMFEKANQKEKITLLDEEVNNSIPYYDLKVAAGNFSEDQIASGNKWLELPEDINYSNDYFACKVFGESMNKVIPNGSICLFKKYYGGSRNGEIVLVESSSIQDSDFGSGYTIKEYESLKSIDNTGGWSHSSIRLKPLSYDKSFENINLVEDESVSLNVLGKFIRVL